MLKKIEIPISVYNFIKNKAASFFVDRIGHAGDTLIDNVLDKRNTTKKEYENYIRRDVSDLSAKIENLEAVVVQSLRVYDRLMEQLEPKMNNTGRVILVFNGDVQFHSQVIIQNVDEMNVSMESKNIVNAIIDKTMSEMFICKQDNVDETTSCKQKDNVIKPDRAIENNTFHKTDNVVHQHVSILEFAKRLDNEAEEKLRKMRSEKK